ncbi:MAG: GC-type dockerin domain-anchored protein, partial [Planctomycetota bacterium]
DHSVNVLANPFAEAGIASGTRYILTTGEYTCRADVNLDGFVTPADFNAWILAFNAQSVTCDQNGNGVCEPGDFNAWILNFNSLAGCGS